MSNQQNFMPFLLPLGQLGQQQPSCDHRVPARIRIAVEFLNQLSAKTAERAAVNDVSVQSIPGQTLTPGEADAHETACHLLIQYFEGKLRPNEIEFLETEGMKRAGSPTGGRGVLIRCLACDSGAARADCSLCRGTGYSLIYPCVEDRS